MIYQKHNGDQQLNWSQEIDKLWQANQVMKMLSVFPNFDLRGGPGKDQRAWQTCLSTILVP